MNLNPFMVFNRSFKCDSTNTSVLVKWFNRFKYLESPPHYDFACPLRARLNSFILDDDLSVMEVGSSSSLNCKGGRIEPSCSFIGGGGGGLLGFGGLCAFYIWSGLSVLGFGIGLYPSRNCSGGGMIMSSYSLTICLTIYLSVCLSVCLSTIYFFF